MGLLAEMETYQTEAFQRPAAEQLAAIRRNVVRSLRDVQLSEARQLLAEIDALQFEAEHLEGYRADAEQQTAILRATIRDVEHQRDGWQRTHDLVDGQYKEVSASQRYWKGEAERLQKVADHLRQPVVDLVEVGTAALNARIAELEDAARGSIRAIEALQAERDDLAFKHRDLAASYATADRRVTELWTEVQHLRERYEPDEGPEDEPVIYTKDGPYIGGKWPEFLPGTIMVNGEQVYTMASSPVRVTHRGADEPLATGYMQVANTLGIVQWSDPDHLRDQCLERIADLQAGTATMGAPDPQRAEALKWAISHEGRMCSAPNIIETAETFYQFLTHGKE